MRNELRGYMSHGSREFFESLIGDQLHMSHDFKVIIPGKGVQCYYQEAEPETSISMNFEVRLHVLIFQCH